MLREDNSGAISWYDLFTALEPVIKKIIEKLKKEFVFIPLWHDYKNKYVYHIENSLREGMYSYLRGEDQLKRFGLAFGNEQLISHSKRLFDIGIYGFLPFYEIAHFRGSEKIGDKRIIDLCRMFEKGIRSKDISDIEKAAKIGKLLVSFVLNKCGDEDFPKMLVRGSNSFANAYMKLYKDIEDGPHLYEQVVLSRFLKASFQGMYINSSKFVSVALSTNPKEFLKQTEEIASKIGKEPLQAVKGFEKFKFIDKLVAIFEPTGRADIIASALGRMPAVVSVLTDKLRLKKLNILYGSFKEEVEGFDAETRRRHGVDDITYYRVPIVVNVYRDENAKILRSVCTAYNKNTKTPQQIKFLGKLFGKGAVRCLKIADKYFVKG